MWEWISDWLARHQTLLVWLGVLSIASLLLAALLLPVVIVRLPADYFVREHHIGHGRRSWLDWLWHLGKNLLGTIFLLAGIAMLVLPGQGLLTILFGILMLDLPGKRRLERAIVARPGILAIVNRMRQRRGKPPIVI